MHDSRSGFDCLCPGEAGIKRMRSRDLYRARPTARVDTDEIGVRRLVSLSEPKIASIPSATWRCRCSITWPYVFEVSTMGLCSKRFFTSSSVRPSARRNDAAA